MLRQRHPPGLYALFAIEMWERFGFYCMAAVFMLYMSDEKNGHPFLQNNASLLNGLYLGTVYFTPFFGGMLADQKWGYRASILLGAVFMAGGYFFMAVDQLFFFFLGLLCIVLGNGLFKPNISTLVGKLYAPNDPRLDSAYTIFYMGIKLLASAAPLVAGYLRVRYGFHVAITAAGVGMILSMILFVSFERWLVLTGHEEAKASSSRAGVHEVEVPADVQRRRHLALLIVFAIVALFWMAFKQNVNTLQLWAQNCTDRTPPSWLNGAGFLLDKEGMVTTEFANSINPMLVVLLSPLMVQLWLSLKGAGLEPTTPSKVGLGMVLAAMAFVLLALGGLAGGDTPGVLVSPWYLIGAYFLLTVGELCLSPLGLSLVAKLAAPKQRSAWMGGWFVATAVGGYLSGIVGMLWKPWPHSQFFLLLAGTSLGAALLLLACLKRLNAAMPAPRLEPTVPVSMMTLPPSKTREKKLMKARKARKRR